MSGIINSAGSRSGVIGTTELDYEEGTWNPVPRGHSGTAGSHAHNMSGQYTKIGGLVTVTGQGVISNLGDWTGNFRCLGLPFTNIRQDGAGALCLYPSAVVDAVWRAIYIFNNQTYIAFQGGSKMDTAALYSEIVISTYLNFTCTYFCSK